MSKVWWHLPGGRGFLPSVSSWSLRNFQKLKNKERKQKKKKQNSIKLMLITSASGLLVPGKGCVGGFSLQVRHGAELCNPHYFSHYLFIQKHSRGGWGSTSTYLINLL